VAEGISIYLKDLSDPMRNLCLCVHDCLFDRKSIQSVVCLVASAAATIRFRRLIEGTPKIIARSPAISPRKFATDFLDP